VETHDFETFGIISKCTLKTLHFLGIGWLSVQQIWTRLGFNVSLGFRV
jgi:hypothetical protein